ncbi:MAG: hypothetical protein KIT19_07795 [Phycisphaeraceae bacterium]|nr:hypothetical protein [Phycisphaeraceae bacterium]
MTLQRTEMLELHRVARCTTPHRATHPDENRPDDPTFNPRRHGTFPRERTEILTLGLEPACGSTHVRCRGGGHPCRAALSLSRGARRIRRLCHAFLARTGSMSPSRVMNADACSISHRV